MFILMILMRAWVRVMMRLGKSESAELSVTERSNKMFTINSLCIRRRLPSGPVIDFPPISLSPYHYFSQKHICLDKHFSSSSSPMHGSTILDLSLCSVYCGLDFEAMRSSRVKIFTCCCHSINFHRRQKRLIVSALVLPIPK